MNLRFICSTKSLNNFRPGQVKLPTSHQLATPRQASLSSSAQRGHFVNALRRANTAHHLAGAAPCPILQRPITTKVKQSITTPQSTMLPKCVRGWPTPILTQEDIDTYLIPLYSQGWSIDYRQGKAKNQQSHVLPVLQVFFEIPNLDSLRELVTLIQQLERSENHHVELKLPDREPFLSSQELLDLDFDFESPCWVAICLCTHSAILPRSGETGGEAEARRRVSGLTLRDVRFAMLFDDLVEKRNTQAANSKLVKNTTMVSAQPGTLSDLFSGSLDRDGSHYAPVP